MRWVSQNYKWLFDGIGGLVFVGAATWLLNRLSPRWKRFLASRRGDLAPADHEMGQISFAYLPASPLLNGWRLALKEKPSFKSSVPPDRPDGLRIEAEDAIDCDVDKYQRVCNSVQFAAKLHDQSHVYARIRLASRDGQAVSRVGWIACDVGDRPPREESRDEWVIHRMPGSDGWALFELFLPEEVSRTFGKAEGLRFSELLGFRLRGSLSISPIRLLRREPAATSVRSKDDKNPAQAEPWSRAEKIGAWSVLLAFLAIVATLTVPEARRFLGLEHPAPLQPLQPRAAEPMAVEGSGKPPAAGTVGTGAEDTRATPSRKKSEPLATVTQKSTGVDSPNNAVVGNNIQVGNAQNPTAIAPNGIANTAPNFGSETVNNFGPPSRRISQQQHDQIVAMLTGEHPVVIVWASATDKDTWGLAEDLYHALKDSGWSMKDSDVQAALAVNPGQFDVAIFIPGDPSQPVTEFPQSSAPGEIVEALKALGLTFGMGHSERLEDAAVKLVVEPR